MNKDISNTKGQVVAPLSSQNATKKSKSARRRANRKARGKVEDPPHVAFNRRLAKQESQGLPPRMRKLVSSFVLPKENDPVRLGNEYGADPTAVSKLFRKVNVKPNTSGNPGDIPATDVVAFAYRDPLRSLVYSYGLGTTPSDTYAYQATLSFSVAKGAPFYFEYDGPMYGDQTQLLPHGDVLYPGRLGLSDQHRGWLCNTGDTLRLVIAGIPGVSSLIYYVLHKLEGAQWVAVDAAFPQQLTANSGGTLNWSITSIGYYSFRCSIDTTSSLAVGTSGGGNLSIFNTANTRSSIFGQMSLPRIEEVLTSVKACRIPAVSLMYTNTASPLNRQGQVAGVQLPKGSHWPDYLTFEEIAGVKKSTTLNVVNGMYGFLKPTSSTDMKMTVFQTQSGPEESSEDAAFLILPDSDYLVVYAEINIADGRQGYFTPCHHIEFDTLNQWFDCEVTDLRPGEVQQTLQIVGRLPQWHENDFHISDLWEGIKSVASDIWNGIKEVGSTVGPYLPLVAPLLL